jgi:hypothetical protein
LLWIILIDTQAEIVHVVRPLAANLRGSSTALAVASPHNLKPTSPVLAGGYKASAPVSRLPPLTTAPNQSPDPSRPVKEFLRSLDYNLEVLFDEFVDAGIKDDATLMIFKKLGDEDKVQFLMEDMRLDRLQRFVLRKCLKTM